MKRLYPLLLLLLCACTPGVTSLHFSPSRGWINDPNGMVYKDGAWHLYYQHNPYGEAWGNMSWGHAASTDLVRWTEHPVVLYPDSLGMIFSGSAAVDGDRIVAMYTSAGARQAQSLAFSGNGGETFDKWSENPVLTSDRPDFRDPKLFRYGEGWRVIVAAGDAMEIYSSDDLLTWTFESRFGEGTGCHGGVWECPDLFPLGDRWVLVCSCTRSPDHGSATQYFIGDFDGHVFTPDDTQERWLDEGPDFYAAVTWSDAPSGRRVLLGWQNNWKYAGERASGGRRGQMTLPRELRLATYGGRTVVASLPAPEVLKNASRKCVLRKTLRGISDWTLAGLTLHIAPDTVTLERGGQLVGSAPLEERGSHEVLAVVADDAVEFFIDGGAVCLSCLAPPERAAGKVTVASLLREITDPATPTVFPDYVAHMTSSHDRRSVTPGTPEWFANDDGFGYERLDTLDGRIEKVLFEDTHPGAVMRFWLTTHSPKGTLRFYFDGHSAPDWVVPAFDLTDFGLDALEGNPLLQRHTSYERGVKGGQTLFLPIPYATGCKITLEEPEGWSDVPRYYQIEARRYPDGTAVETFSPGKYTREIRRAGRQLAEGLAPKGRPVSRTTTLQPGGTLSLDLPDGERAVTELSVQAVAPDCAAALHTLVLEAVFDGTRTVQAPLDGFSGAGFGARAVACRQLDADGEGTAVSRWVMPYRHSGQFRLTNIASEPVEVHLSARTCRHRFTERTLYFHASYHAADGLPVTNVAAECKEWDFTRITGRGVYAGDNLTLFNHSRAWYGEGDEKIWIDGESFPSFFGTGTEDYYNSSWAPVVVFHTPWGGAPRADLPSSQGYNTFLRTRLGDLIPFRRSLRFDFELMSWVPGVVDYAATTWWYGDLDAGALQTDPATLSDTLPEAPPDPARFVREGAVEAESLTPVFVSEGLQMDRQDMAGFPDGVWSGARQLVFYGGREGDRAVLRLTGLPDGPCRVSAFFTMAADYGIVSYALNGRKTGELDGWFPSVVNAGPVLLGETDIEGGVLDLTLTVAGRNPASTGTMFGLDCIIVEEIN